MLVRISGKANEYDGLMLLMLATSVSGLLWMLALAAVMAVEKNTRWGRRIVAPLGVALVISGAMVLLAKTPVVGP